MCNHILFIVLFFILPFAQRSMPKDGIHSLCSIFADIPSILGQIRAEIMSGPLLVKLHEEMMANFWMKENISMQFRAIERLLNKLWWAIIPVVGDLFSVPSYRLACLRGVIKSYIQVPDIKRSYIILLIGTSYLDFAPDFAPDFSPDFALFLSSLSTLSCLPSNQSSAFLAASAFKHDTWLLNVTKANLWKLSQPFLSVGLINQ